MYTHTYVHTREQSRQKGATVFSSKVFTHDQQTSKAHSRIFWGTFYVPCLGKHHHQCTGVRQLFQAVTQNQIQVKWISPSCCHGSSKYSNGVPLCRGPRLRECTTAWQSVRLRGRIKHASMPLAHSLYSFPNHQRQRCTVADKKEVKLLKNRTSRLGVESAVCGVEVKEMPLFSQQHCQRIRVSASANLNVTAWFIHLFQYASKCVTVCLWSQFFFFCFTSQWENCKRWQSLERSKRGLMLRVTASGKDTGRCFHGDNHCGISLQSETRPEKIGEKYDKSFRLDLNAELCTRASWAQERGRM